MPALRRRLVLWTIGLVALGAAAALAFYLSAGDRYRLYTSPFAADCWRAVELTTLSSSTIEPAAVGAPMRDTQDRVHVSIDYTMDRVLGGSTLNVACVFEAGDGALESVEFDGIALDAETLETVNRELAGP